MPRRAGDRGAVDAGLPAQPAARRPPGRPTRRPGPSSARPGTSAVDGLPAAAGRDTDGIIAAAADGQLGALVVAGVDPADLADPRLADQALDAVPFLVSLELRQSAVTRRADVVLPVAPAVEKAGTFMDWEGRLRTFDAVLPTAAMTDARVLEAIAALMDVTLGTGDVAAIRRELGTMPASRSDRPAAPSVAAGTLPDAGERRGGAGHLAPPHRPGRAARR